MSSYADWRLTPMQERVLVEFCKTPDDTHPRISARLGVSPSTTKAHVEDACQRMGVRSLRAAVLMYDRARRPG